LNRPRLWNVTELDYFTFTLSFVGPFIGRLHTSSKRPVHDTIFLPIFW
jgi:hypothetical protein